MLYCGAGAFRDEGDGIRFQLAAAAGRERSLRVTAKRGREDGRFRLHVAGGDTLCSESALWLRFATTALIARLGEADVPRCAMPDPAGADPVPPVLMPWRLGGDRPLEGELARHALAVQRRLILWVQSYAGGPFMPWWAGIACRRWRRMLGDLERNAADLERELDWALKQALWRRRQARHRARQPPLWPGMESPPDRNALVEFDLRFGQLHPPGLFERFDAAGVLRHRVVRPEAVEKAVSEPPARSRARARGRAILELFRSRTPARAHWDLVLARAGAGVRSLSLDDPRTESADWVEALESGSVPGLPPGLEVPLSDNIAALLFGEEWPPSSSGTLLDDEAGTPAAGDAGRDIFDMTDEELLCLWDPFGRYRNLPGDDLDDDLDDDLPF